MLLHSLSTFAVGDYVFTTYPAQLIGDFITLEQRETPPEELEMQRLLTTWYDTLIKQGTPGEMAREILINAAQHAFSQSLLDYDEGDFADLCRDWALHGTKGFDEMTVAELIDHLAATSYADGIEPELVCEVVYNAHKSWAGTP